MDPFEAKISELEAAIKQLRIGLRNRKKQEKRTISHLESEQRVYNQHGKRIDTMEAVIERIVKDQEEHRKMLLNSGSGLMFRMRDQETKEREGKDNMSRWLAVASIIVALLSFASKYIHL